MINTHKVQPTPRIRMQGKFVKQNLLVEKVIKLGFPDVQGKVSDVDTVGHDEKSGLMIREDLQACFVACRSTSTFVGVAYIKKNTKSANLKQDFFVTILVPSGSEDICIAHFNAY